MSGVEVFGGTRLELNHWVKQVAFLVFCYDSLEGEIMSVLGNMIWFIFGGFFMGATWCIVGILAFLSILGIPWGRACFVIGLFSFFPFGQKIIPRETANQKEDIGTGTLGMVGNIIWFIIAGWWLAFGHLISGLLCAMTIIGIPFALQHIKLAKLSLAPIGKTAVPTS